MLLPELSSSLLRRRGSKTLLAFLHHRSVGDPLSFSWSSVATAAAAAAVKSSSPGPQFMVEYLITSCGLSPSEAAKASKHLRRIKSPQRPDSVLGFFKSQGFDDADIKKIVARQPGCLGFDVEKTLAPKFRALRDLGFSQSDLPHLVLSHPSVLNLRLHRTLLPRIELWRNLFGSMELLKKFLKRKNWFLCWSIEKRILPNLSLLRDYGIPDNRISLMVRQHPSLIVRSSDSLRHLVSRVEELGVPPYSGMFAWVLQTLHTFSKARFAAKMELMRSFGWSESEFLTAVSKAPGILNVSKKMMQRKMKFLVKEAGCTASYVSRFPVLLMYSLDKRLIPRYRAVEILKSKGLRIRKWQLFRIMCVSEKDFFEKFILCHKEEVPELHEIFTAGCEKAAS